jgi:ribonuclease T
MSDAESTGAAAKTALVLETPTIVVETSHPAAAERTANDDGAPTSDPTTGDDTATALTATVASAPAEAVPNADNATPPSSVLSGVSAVATAVPNARNDVTPSARPSNTTASTANNAPTQATASIATLMSRRFRGFLPVVVDVETGGFHSSTDALLEIAAVIIDMEPDGTLKRGATHSFHVKPFEGARLDPAALAITGIDPFHPLRPALPEKDALGRVFREIRHAIHAYNCRRAILVGHNAAFDLGFLNAAVTRADVKRNPFHPFSCFDTATLAGAALGQTVLAKALAVAGLHWDPSNAHSASYDAEKTADMFCLICNRLSDSFQDAQRRARAMGWVSANAPAAEAAEEPSLET